MRNFSHLYCLPEWELGNGGVKAVVDLGKEGRLQPRKPSFWKEEPSERIKSQYVS
jgi:hypothetical protein